MAKKDEKISIVKVDEVKDKLEAMTATGIIGLGVSPLSREQFINAEDTNELQRKLRQ